MLLYTMLYIVLAYLMLFAALTNSVCLNNASFFFLFKYFLCQGYELSGEIALKIKKITIIIILLLFKRFSLYPASDASHYCMVFQKYIFNYISEYIWYSYVYLVFNFADCFHNSTIIMIIFKCYFSRGLLDL